MKWLAIAVSMIALAWPMAASAAPKHHPVHAARWHHLSLHQKRPLVVRTITKERAPVRWWLRHRTRIPASASGPLVYCASVGTHLPSPVCVHAFRLVNAIHVLRRIDARLAAIARAEAARQLAASFPPHHALWTCIGRYEGSPTSVNPNGHYGMLQMTYNWFGVISGKASDYSQAVQEWAAEKVYAKQSDKAGFLNGQWFNYDAADGCIVYA